MKKTMTQNIGRRISCGLVASMVIAASLFVATEANAQNTGTRRLGKTETSSRDIKKEFDVFIKSAVEDIKAGKKTKDSVLKDFRKRFPEQRFSNKATKPLGSETDYKSFSEKLDVVLKVTPAPSDNQIPIADKANETTTGSSKGENLWDGFKLPALYGEFEYRRSL